ncbi:biotin/lipoyl-binding protein [Mesosutterella sp. AGMB02718]|uniref:Biotin/lipoyl-binding protein n=1 Tax=Mesosutterella faecium TaxID=2925194 RepID=A0ABT7IPE3_9BURK|nr:biotin/lipoyl-binding protein [Mesosutterella sp. AGMB02718]MDL2060247.1 biotin/lipoyl-binding protein [Mesosutterella sp. AGMB02718]
MTEDNQKMVQGGQTGDSGSPAQGGRPQRLGRPAGGRRELLKPVAALGALFAVGVLLMLLGPRHDADTLAQRQKYGILTAEEVNVAFEKVSGRLVERPVQEGGRVKKGEPLMTLDGVDNAIAVKRLKAQIAENEASVESEKRQIGIDLAAASTTEKNAWRTIEADKATLDSAAAAERRARADYGRARGLVGSGAVSQSSFDSAKSSWESAAAALANARKNLAAATVGANRSDLARLERTGSAEGMRLSSIADTRASIENRRLKVRQLEAQGEQLRADLESLQVERGRLTLTAPEDGKIVKLLYQPGDMVSAGSPAVLLQSSRQYYEIYVSEKDVPRFSEGSTVTGTTASGRKVQGIVRVLYRAPSFAEIRGTRERGQADLTSFIARIYVTPQSGVEPGMTIEVKTHA